eukprot:740248-Prymnesium_polylepis.1
MRNYALTSNEKRPKRINRIRSRSACRTAVASACATAWCARGTGYGLHRAAPITQALACAQLEFNTRYTCVRRGSRERDRSRT